MTYQGVASIIFRCIGFYNLIMVISNLPGLIFVAKNQSNGNLTPMVAQIILDVLLSLVFILLSDKISEKLVKAPEIIDLPEIKTEKILVILLCVLGFYITISAFPQLIITAELYASYPESVLPNDHGLIMARLNVICMTIKLLMGICLIIFPKKIISPLSNYWNKSNKD